MQSVKLQIFDDCAFAFNSRNILPVDEVFVVPGHNLVSSSLQVNNVRAVSRHGKAQIEKMERIFRRKHV